MSDVTAEPRRARAGRKPARSAAPWHNPSLECPFITRKIPTYDILNDESLTKIEVTADRILSEIGIEFREDPETVELFRAAGGEVRPVTDRSGPAHVQGSVVSRVPYSVSAAGSAQGLPMSSDSPGSVISIRSPVMSAARREAAWHASTAGPGPRCTCVEPP